MYSAVVRHGHVVYYVPCIHSGVYSESMMRHDIIKSTCKMNISCMNSLSIHFHYDSRSAVPSVVPSSGCAGGVDARAAHVPHRIILFSTDFRIRNACVFYLFCFFLHFVRFVLGHNIDDDRASKQQTHICLSRLSCPARHILNLWRTHKSEGI